MDIVHPIIGPLDQSAFILTSEPLLITNPKSREDSFSKQEVPIINNGILNPFLTFSIYCIASSHDTSSVTL